MSAAINEGYGIKLQRPEDAADGIRTITLSHVVSTDVREVVRALDRERDHGKGIISVGVNLDILFASCEV